MNRRDFTTTCISCLAGTLVAPLLSSCQSAYYTTGSIEKDGISVSPAEFSFLKNDKRVERTYVIVRNDTLEFPIYLFKHSDSEYSALLMKCTHQGNELQASGDHLHCPAHGSEFNNKGVVAQGPAEKNLRTFKVTASPEKLFIDLRT